MRGARDLFGGVLRFHFLCFFIATAALAQQPADPAPKPAAPPVPKTVYLTFDDGPEIGTADVLDVLKAHGATACFFLTGSNAQLVGGLDVQAALVKREVAEGHTLGNHCYIHSPMRKREYVAKYGDLTTEEQRVAFRNNYARNVDHFRARLEQPNFKFQFARLPGDGSTFPALVKETEALGMRHFHWQWELATNRQFSWLHVHDWQGIVGVDSEEPGLPPNNAVILFHDRHWRGENKQRLDAMLTMLEKNGYSFGKPADWKPAPAPTTPPKPKAPATPAAAPATPAAPTATTK